MKLRDTILIAVTTAALAAPLAVSAQSWGWYGGGGRGDYSGYRGGYQQTFRGYPEFQGLKSHIRQEIRDGLQDGWLDQDQAQDLYRRLDWVQRSEQREFREHGWQLPYNDRAQIRSSLNNLDRAIDQARDEDGDDY